MRLLAAAAGLFAAAALDAKVFLTQEEALKLAFPGATVERHTAYLTEAQQKAAKKLSGDEELPSALATYYVGNKDGRAVVGAAVGPHLERGALPGVGQVDGFGAGAGGYQEGQGHGEEQAVRADAHEGIPFRGVAKGERPLTVWTCGVRR